MQYFYRRYAYSDSIELDNVQILNTCRDKEFERWLNIIGKDIKSHLEISKADASVSKELRSFMPFSSFFRFERQLSITQNNERIIINHSPNLIAYSEIVGAYKKSYSRDIMIRTEFKSHPKSPDETNSPSYENLHAEDFSIAKHKVSIGKITSTPIETNVNNSLQSKQMRGAEVDESF